MHVSRIVAVAGDTIELRCRVLFRNGQAQPTTVVAPAERYTDSIDGEPRTYEVARLRQTIAGHAFEVFHSSDPEPRQFPDGPVRTCPSHNPYGEPQVAGLVVATGAAQPGSCAAYEHYVVPSGHVFLMSDNRDYAMDSRIFGAVPLANVVGTATGVVWPLSRLGRM